MKNTKLQEKFHKELNINELYNPDGDIEIGTHSKAYFKLYAAWLEAEISRLTNLIINNTECNSLCDSVNYDSFHNETYPTDLPCNCWRKEFT